MTILNTDSIGNYVAITPIKCNFTDTVNANALVAILINDNLTTSCVVQYQLINLVQTQTESPPVTTTTYQVMFTGSTVIQGSDYTNWEGNSSYVYTYIASQLNLTLL